MNLILLLWSLTIFDGNYWSRQECDGSFTVQPKPLYAVMLTEECGDIYAAYISFTVRVDGVNPVFVYRGVDLWNICSGTNQVRVFFTDTTNTYSSVASGQSGHPNSYWWSQSYIYVDPSRWTLGYPATLAANVLPWEWTNGIGHNGVEDWEAFEECARNAKRVGLSFGNNCLYDTGIALLSGSSTISVSE